MPFMLVSQRFVSLSLILIAGLAGASPAPKENLCRVETTIFQGQPIPNDRLVRLKIDEKTVYRLSGSVTNPTEKILDKFRLFVPRDGGIQFTSTINSTIKVTAGDVTKEVDMPAGSTFFQPASDVSIEIFDAGDRRIAQIEQVAAKRLGILTQVGSSAFFTSGDDFGGYDLVQRAANDKRIVRKSSRSISANLTGQLYVPFDDEFGLSPLGNAVGKAITLGMFNPEHHRLGIMAGIAASDATEPTYQLGLAWFLDPSAKVVISAGVMFRRQDRLLFGLKEGDSFAGSTLPTRQTWRDSLFLGFSFNLGD